MEKYRNYFCTQKQYMDKYKNISVHKDNTWINIKILLYTILHKETTSVHNNRTIDANLSIDH